MMDELLGYPTEFRPDRIRLAWHERAVRALWPGAVRNAARQGFASEVLDAAQIRELVPLAGDNMVGGYLYRFGGHANPHRTRAGLRLGDAGPRRPGDAALRRDAGSRRAGGRVTAVRTDRGPIGCDHVVMAAGPADRGRSRGHARAPTSRWSPPAPR